MQNPFQLFINFVSHKTNADMRLNAFLRDRESVPKTYRVAVFLLQNSFFALKKEIVNLLLIGTCADCFEVARFAAAFFNKYNTCAARPIRFFAYKHIAKIA